MDDTLIIKVGSSISSDGFVLEIPEKFRERYWYGHNASYNKVFVDKDKPYISDIIYDVMKEYNISPENVHVTGNKNVFKGATVSNEEVKNFSDKYLSEVFEKFI